MQVHSQKGLGLLRQIALWGQHTQYQTATKKLITLRTPYELLPGGLRAISAEDYKKFHVEVNRCFSVATGMWALWNQGSRKTEC